MIKKSRWDLESSLLGVTIEIVDQEKDIWRVLWCLEKSYKLQDHIGSSLLELDGSNDSQLTRRLCTTM